jgi:shikimate kinase
MTGPAEARHVVLVGLMGSGKSTVGARLAALLGRPLVDSDADIEAAHGATARELAARDGIEALHALEREHLLAALAAPTPSVVAAAASTLDDPACVAALSGPDVRTIWLRGTPTTLATRIAAKDHRPDFGPDLVAVIVGQAARRNGALARVADETIDIDGLSPDRIVERLVG